MNKKIVNNAICAYFGLGVILLFPSKNQYINNIFVKTHAKTASFIHLLFLITYIIFVSYGFLGNFMIFGVTLNNIIAPIIFLVLFGWLIFGTYKAKNGIDFNLDDLRQISKTSNIFSIKQSNLNEQGILTTILSLIPFIGFTLKGKYNNYKSPILENNLKLNLLLSLVVYIVFLLGYSNLGSLLGLVQIIFIVFYGIMIVGNQNIISINLGNTPTASEFFYGIIALYRYLMNYFKSKDFKTFQTYFQEITNSNLEISQKRQYEVLSLNEAKLKTYFYYIPYLNLLGIVDYKSKYKYHVKNGIILSILSLIFLALGNNTYQIIVGFLAFFGIGYLKDLTYSFPILGEIYLGIESIFKKIFGVGKKVQETSKKVEEVSFKL